MLFIAISTIYANLNRISKHQFPIDPDIKYIVSCQGKKTSNDSYYIDLLKDIFGNNVIYSLTEDIGLSKNRNNTIDLAILHAKNNCNIYFCDDDVSINIENLKSSSLKIQNSLIDGLTGKIATKKGDFKKYNPNSFKHNRLSLMKVSSVEIMISVDFLKKNKIKFNEYFGLGSNYPSGEEFIFLTDILKNHGKIFFVPFVFCSHPIISSGHDFFSDSKKIKTKGAMFYAVFGNPLWLLLSIAFSIKKLHSYNKEVKFLFFLKNIINGGIEFSKKQ